MTIAQLLIATITSQVLFVLAKLIFINILNIDSLVIRIALWLSLVIISIAVVRRLGPLNYLESFFITILWFLISMAVDFVITSAFTGRDVYKTWYWWIAYFCMIIAVFLFHKKFHVENRRLMAEQSKK